MIKKDNLVNFKKMWTWLSGYPAHDQEYYMENVATLDGRWANGCPLADCEGDSCNGCEPIWQSDTKSKTTSLAWGDWNNDGVFDSDLAYSQLNLGNRRATSTTWMSGSCLLRL